MAGPRLPLGVVVGGGVLESEYASSKNDTSLYVYESQGKWVACAVFVDDILVTGTDTRKITELKALFKTKFRGEHQWDENINSFLGMAVYYHDDIKTGILTMDVKAFTYSIYITYDEVEVYCRLGFTRSFNPGGVER